jgi:hypothetical protein
LFFVLGGCAALSNITHYTFVSQLSAKHTSFLAVGIALGSMTSGMLAILQGSIPTASASFGVSGYYAALTALFLPAFFALHLIEGEGEGGEGDGGEEEGGR